MSYQSEVESRREALLTAVFDELRRAEALHASWPPDLCTGVAIITEEVGELARACLQFKYEPGKAGWPQIEAEAIQVAAMGLRFLFNLPERTDSASVESSAESEGIEAGNGTIDAHPVD